MEFKSKYELPFNEIERPRKKRRLSPDVESERIGSLDDAIGSHSTDSLKNNRDVPKSQKDVSKARRDGNVNNPAKSVRRSISPPPVRSRQQSAKDSTESSSLQNGHQAIKEKETTKKLKEASQSLNPRLLKKPPATHDVRLKLLKYLHEQLTRLNNEVHDSQDASREALELSPQELIILALDEEEKAAKENPSVYLNVLKLRIGALKKMKLDGWRKERLKQIAKDHPVPPPPAPTSTPLTITTGLTPQVEILILPKLLAKQSDLSQHGYIPTAPTPSDVEQARSGVEASRNWEVCDRCKIRFQVFPGRREEDGALTTGGKCTYHWGRARRPPKEKSDTGPKDTAFSCCGEALGTPGCTTAATHVYKVSEAKRLELVMPFMVTPVEGAERPEKAVCFDCEMGYTTLGLELIRLTATAWPDGREVLDVLVRPLGEVLDLNSRFSGVWPKHFAEAVPYSKDVARVEGDGEGVAKGERLMMVESPFKARELLFELLTTTTPLIGHAIENDLNATRIIHPSIIDTVLLFPHARGLPMRHGLKMLMQRYLNRDIQMGGDLGHDSKEDARAAGDLVRLKVGEIWKVMKRDGWTVKKGEFHPPEAKRKAP